MRGRGDPRVFVAEGARAVRAALEAGADVRELTQRRTCSSVTADAELVTAAELRGVRVVELGREAFLSISRNVRADGLLGVVTRPSTALARLALPARPLIVVAEAVERPGNLGTIVRTAAGSGADALLVADPRTDVFHPEVVRGSVGTIFHLPIGVSSSERAPAWLGEHDVRIVLATPEAARPYWDADYSGAVARRGRQRARRHRRRVAACSRRGGLDPAARPRGLAERGSRRRRGAVRGCPSARDRVARRTRQCCALGRRGSVPRTPSARPDNSEPTGPRDSPSDTAPPYRSRPPTGHRRVHSLSRHEGREDVAAGLRRSVMAAVAVVGLGAMGSRSRAGSWARDTPSSSGIATPAKAEPLAAAGARVAATPADAAANAEAVVTMVADPQALRDVTEGPDGVVAGLTSGTTLIQMSTVGPESIRRLASVVPDGALLDAPVLGSISEAESGTLTIFASGPPELVERATPLLSALGKVQHVGPLGAGTAAKLVANSTLVTVLTALGEALALAQTLGLSRDAAFDVLAATPLAAQAERRRPATRERPLRPEVPAAARAQGRRPHPRRRRVERRLRVVAAARTWLVEAEENGHGAEDYSAVLEHILRTVPD